MGWEEFLARKCKGVTFDFRREKIREWMRRFPAGANRLNEAAERATKSVWTVYDAELRKLRALKNAQP
jgi:hypothetical protein